MDQQTDMTVNQEGLSSAAPSAANHDAPAVSAKSQPENNQQEAKILGMPVPKGIVKIANNSEKVMANWRQRSIRFLPAFVVNNSSNILGFSHVLTEMAMLQASMAKRGKKLVENPTGLHDYILQPVTSLYKGTVENAHLGELRLKSLFKGNFFSNVVNRLNTTNATALEYERQMAKGVLRENVGLGNGWQARATLAGLTVWTLSMFLPEKKESAEEIEHQATLKATHPIKYYAGRVGQALWVPGWIDHKRQMIGLGMFIAGACSMLGGWRNRKEVEAGAELFDKTTQAFKTYKYNFSTEYFATGVIGFLASLPLMFKLDEKSAYSDFGWTYFTRTLILPFSLGRKFRDKEPGRQWYTGAALSFQFENAMQGLWGGAQKIKKTMPDGTVVEEIVDNHAAIEEGKLKGKLEKQQAKIDKALGKDQNDQTQNINTDTAATDQSETKLPVKQPHADMAVADEASKTADEPKKSAMRHPLEQRPAELKRPATSVTATKHAERAMPERFEAHQQHAAEATA